MHSKSPGTTPELQTLSRDDFWQKHVSQWLSSDLSKMAYCRKHALSYHQMVYWSNKERQCLPETDKPYGGFVAVAVAPAALSSSSLSVCLPSGLRIEGINERSVALVGALLEQL